MCDILGCSRPAESRITFYSATTLELGGKPITFRPYDHVDVCPDCEAQANECLGLLPDGGDVTIVPLDDLREFVYALYERPFNSPVTGTGKDTAIVEEGKVVLVVRGYDDSSVIPDSPSLIWAGKFIGGRADNLPATWHRLSPEDETDAQVWALDVLSVLGPGA